MHAINKSAPTTDTGGGLFGLHLWHPLFLLLTPRLFTTDPLYHRHLCRALRLATAVYGVLLRSTLFTTKPFFFLPLTLFTSDTCGGVFGVQLRHTAGRLLDGSQWQECLLQGLSLQCYQGAIKAP